MGERRLAEHLNTRTPEPPATRTPTHVELGVAAVIRQGGSVLLVREVRPGHTGPFWASPGGHVEPGEQILDALVREVREETGLTVVKPGPIAFVVQYTVPAGAPPGLIFYFEVEAWTGEPHPQDPAGVVAEARFLALPDAIETLERHLPWRREQEPNCAYLRGDVPPGSLWAYERDAAGTDRLLARPSARHYSSVVRRKR